MEVAIMDYEIKHITIYTIPDIEDSDELEEYLIEHCDYNDSCCYYMVSTASIAVSDMR